MRLITRLVIATVVASALTSVAPAGAEPSSRSEVVAKARAARPAGGVVLTSPRREVEEGDRLRLTAKVKKPRRAKRAVLQLWTVPIYYGSPSWETVRTARVKRKRVRFNVVVTSLNTARYRVVVPQGRRMMKSRPVSIKVWRWIELREFASYYSTNVTGVSEKLINGSRHRAWGPQYAISNVSWESRYTPGRNCKAFSGVAGLWDASADGSSGVIVLHADDDEIYRSKQLTPGVEVRFQVPLARPYRLALQAFNTSAEDLDAWPLIGDPSLLCTGV